MYCCMHWLLSLVLAEVQCLASIILYHRKVEHEVNNEPFLARYVLVFYVVYDNVLAVICLLVDYWVHSLRSSCSVKRSLLQVSKSS